MMSGYGLIQIVSPLAGGLIYDFGIVTGVTDTLNKTVSVVEIVSLPTDCTFALEGETSNTYYINFTRRQPVKEDGTYYSRKDEGYDRTSWMWTNELWVRATSTLINRWQAQFNGYTLYINAVFDPYTRQLQHVLDKNGNPTDELERYTDLYPVTRKNVYLKTISFTQNEADTDTISGSLQVVVGGRMTFKVESATGTNTSNFMLIPLKDYNDRLDSLLENVIATRMPLYAPAIGESAPAFAYNNYNNANFIIEKPDKLITITYDSSGGEKELLLLKGRDQNEPQDALEYEMDFSDELDILESCHIVGGPSKPFESATVKINMKRMSAVYPELVEQIKSGELTEQSSYWLEEGKSKIHINAVGNGEFTLTEYKSNNNTLTLRGYCHAAVLAAFVPPPDMCNLTSPNLLGTILSMLTTKNWGLSKVYDPRDIVCGVRDELNGSHRITIKHGATSWEVLGHLAMVLGCRVFFTSTHAYIVDYSLISKEPDGAPNTTTDNYEFGNRLWMRDGLDFGQNPNDHWGTDDQSLIYEYDSFELHSSKTESRIGGRVCGDVECPQTSDKNIANCVTVKFRSGGSNKSVYVGQYLAEGTSVYCQVSSANAISYGGNDNQKIDLLARGKKSYESIGAYAQEVDLTSVFDEFPEHLAVEYAYSVLKYHLEMPREVTFTLAENFPAQSGANNESGKYIQSTYWSAIFPDVCAVKRFTDVSQDLVVTSLSRLDEQYHSEKTYLASYDRVYPEQQTTYTFGEVTPITLANNANKVESMLKR